MIRSIALLSILLASATAPLIGAELYDEKRVSHIEVIIDGEGEYIDPSPVLSRLKTHEGDTFSQLTFDSDLKELASEYDRVEPNLRLENGQVYITIHIAPKPIIHQIQWAGNDQYSTSTLQKELDIEPNTVFNRQEFNKSFNKIKQFYFKKGYFESQISYSIQPLKDNQIDILIEVDEGRPGHIKEINLIGFTKAEKSDIYDQIILKNYNFLISWLTGSGIYRDEALDQDRMTIINYLHNKGYADARVDIQLIDDPESGKLIIDITAHRGPIYRFGDVTFSGNKLVTDEEVNKKTIIHSGENYSPEKLHETTQAIKELYGQKGYIDANVQYESCLKENEPIFDVHFTIDEGEQYKVGLIHIFGNVSTKNNVILRESLLVPGQTFDARKLKATQQRLEAIGYFKSVNVYAVRSADDDALGSTYRDVYIEVEETTTGNISLFMGFSSMDDVFGGLDLTERNFNIRGIRRALLKGEMSALRGGGEFFHAKGTLGRKQNNILVSWMNPYVNDTLWRLGVEISRTFSELQENVVVVTYGGSVYTNYPLTSFWTVGMRQRIRHSRDNLEIKPLDDSVIAQNSVNTVKDELNQDGLISAFSGNLNYDSVDNVYKPHRGWRSYFETELAGIGGNYNFFKVSYLNSIYFPVWSKGTLKLRGDFKYIFPFGSTSNNKVPYSERFFLGGETSVRGYKPFLLGPVVELLNSSGQKELTDTPYGGLSSTLLSLEYNQEIFRMLDVFAFFDVGSVTFGELQFSELRPSTGVGARIDIGNRTPILVGWGIPLVRKDRHDLRPGSHDKRWQKVFFSMGGQF